jgi:copper homeostasis protein (lipoprotein)
MRRILIAWLFLSSISIYSCRNRLEPAANTPNHEIVDMHNSRISLDWDGVYSGKTPCADCAGIETMIQLNQDLTYIKHSKYLGKSEEVVHAEGFFEWNEAGSSIKLNHDSSKYQVGENILFQLDLQGNRIEGELAQKYMLKKVPDIFEVYWRLIEINEKPVTSIQTNREPHLILNVISNRASGNGGCNSFFGNYQFKDRNQLTFSQLASTKMACTNGMDIENEMFKSFDEVKSFQLIENRMILLNKNDAPLMVLESNK